MRFVDYSFPLLQASLSRLRAGQPINLRHYNSLIAWLALAHDALVDPDRHLARSSNEGSLGDLLFESIKAPSQIGETTRAALGGIETTPSRATGWPETIASALSGAARELGRNYRFLPQQVPDSIGARSGGQDQLRFVGLANDFALSAIDPTALPQTTAIWINPSSVTTILAIQPTIEAMLRAVVNGELDRLPSLVAANPQLTWLADERRVNAMRSEATLVVVLIAMLVALSMLGRPKLRTGGAGQNKAGPIRMPGPNQPIGRAGAGPARLA
jgi:hypothetical protein